ncbi:MAG: hypothetical protein RLZZ450_4689 [Pseudomonadota bacterium]
MNVVWFLVVLAVPTGSYAFYDPADFAAPALEGGGGGRFFTGSPADGQTCSTCHSGGQPPGVDVAGLPARYVPGATYELAVTWSPALGDVGATLEVTDEHGGPAGTLALPPAYAVRDDELCEPHSQRLLATKLMHTVDGRAIAGAGVCGASAVRVQWTAPKANVGLVWLAGSVVVSNQKGDVGGDGVTSFVNSVPPFGSASAEAMNHGCSAAPSARSASLPSFAGVLALGLLLLRGRRSRRRRPWPWLYLAACLLASCDHESLLDPGQPRSMGPVTFQVGAAVEGWDAAQPPLDSGPMPQPFADAAEDVVVQAPSGPSFRLRVTTHPLGGAFAPKYAGAVWVQDEQGKWVKTLAVWATQTLRYLSRYVVANRDGNTVDAVTSATLTEREEHVLTWNLKNALGEAIPDGTYHVMLEATDQNGPGEVLDLPFMKGSAPQTIAPANTPSFENVELVYAGE